MWTCLSCRANVKTSQAYQAELTNVYGEVSHEVHVCGLDEISPNLYSMDFLRLFILARQNVIDKQSCFIHNFKTISIPPLGLIRAYFVRLVCKQRPSR